MIWLTCVEVFVLLHIRLGKRMEREKGNEDKFHVELQVTDTFLAYSILMLKLWRRVVNINCVTGVWMVKT